jgi:RecA-family ATPase
VQELVPMNTVTLFGGDGGTGKSLVALQLAVAVASGRFWLK